MGEFFVTYAGVIVFLHVISAVIWVGGMIAIRFAVHYSMSKIEEPQIRLSRVLELLKRFFNIVIPSIVILLVTAVIISVGFGFKGTHLAPIVHIKEAIWSVMSVIFIIIYIKRNKAEKLFNNGDFKGAKEALMPLSVWMIPLNITLGVVAIFLGVTLRGL
jgi:uncharacterized membrane protein